MVTTESQLGTHRRNVLRSRALFVLGLIAWPSGCTLQDFNRLGPGNSANAGNAGDGGSGGTSSNSTVGNGGSTNVGQLIKHKSL